MYRQMIRNWIGSELLEGEDIHVLEYPDPIKGIYVAIAQRGLEKPRYVGWFFISKEPIDNPFYVFCMRDPTLFDGLWLYRAKHDIKNCTCKGCGQELDDLEVDFCRTHEMCLWGKPK